MYSPMTMEALDAALSAFQRPEVPEAFGHTVRSLTAPSACACGAPTHKGTVWIQTEPSEQERHDYQEAAFLHAGLPVHCGHCGADLGVPTKRGEGLALFRAHEAECTEWTAPGE